MAIIRKFVKNLLFQYTILSLICTIAVSVFVIYVLIQINQNQTVKIHSIFYNEFIESIPENYPEILPALKGLEHIDIHEFEHFLTDINLYPTFNSLKIYNKSLQLIWESRGSFAVKESNRALLKEASQGQFSFEILHTEKLSILNSSFPVFINNHLTGVIEITDIDKKNGSAFEINRSSVILTVLAGGFFFYISLFFLFYKVYQKQEKAYSRLNLSQQLTLHSMSLLAELRDNDTGAHIIRTKTYCRLIGKELKKRKKFKKYLTENYLEDLERSAPLHDIGKVGIPDSILLKPGKLTVEEFEIIKTHPEKGAEVLANAAESLDFQSFFEMGIQIVLHHHENWDGSGYPKGLSGENIPLSARIMALADVYDALRTERTYKAAFSHDKAVQIITEDSGKKFDPEIIDAFLNIEDKFEGISLQ